MDFALVTFAAVLLLLSGFRAAASPLASAVKAEGATQLVAGDSDLSPQEPVRTPRTSYRRYARILVQGRRPGTSPAEHGLCSWMKSGLLAFCENERRAHCCCPSTGRATQTGLDAGFSARPSASASQQSALTRNSFIVLNAHGFARKQYRTRFGFVDGAYRAQAPPKLAFATSPAGAALRGIAHPVNC